MADSTSNPAKKEHAAINAMSRASEYSPESGLGNKRIIAKKVNNDRKVPRQPTASLVFGASIRKRSRAKNTTNIVTIMNGKKMTSWIVQVVQLIRGVYSQTDRAVRGAIAERLEVAACATLVAKLAPVSAI
ncbi:MAG: hypothetical protein ABIO86_02415 [Sphingomonas sp.]